MLSRLYSYFVRGALPLLRKASKPPEHQLHDSGLVGGWKKLNMFVDSKVLNSLPNAFVVD